MPKSTSSAYGGKENNQNSLNKIWIFIMHQQNCHPNYLPQKGIVAQHCVLLHRYNIESQKTLTC
jgi:hypothetical protein